MKAKEKREIKKEERILAEMIERYKRERKVEKTMHKKLFVCCCLKLDRIKEARSKETRSHIQLLIFVIFFSS